MSNKKVSGVGVAVASVLALGSASVSAQGVPGSGASGKGEISIYAGGLFGDDLIDSSLSGEKPQLDDDLVVGARYAYNFTPAFALESGVGFNPNKVKGLSAGDADIDVWTIDFNGVWSFQPGSSFRPYVTAGVGYAFSDLDRPLSGSVGGQPAVIDDDGGVTLNAGFGAKYFLSDRLFLRADARYRWMEKLVDNFDEDLNGGEVTLGLGWTF